VRSAWTYRCLKHAAVYTVALCAALLLGVTSADAATIRQRIVSLAEQEIGYHDHGDYCTKFGPCETWCSLFVTWVWRNAGVPVPSLAFTGYLYDWSRASTYVLGARGVPQPGDAVLFGTGPWDVDTSLHTGIVEASYPGYLVTIEGDSLHGVRRYVVPLSNPEQVGEPGPIYAYASPVSAQDTSYLEPRAPITFQALSPRVVNHQDRHPHKLSETQRLLRAIAALRAFQHMPYRMDQALINWTGINRQGLVEVTVSTAVPIADAQGVWQAFLHRFDDAGHAYTVSFQAPPDPPLNTAVPSISGTPSQDQTLTESHGVWSNSPTVYAYQWEDCDASGQSCSPIGGATGQTYTLTAGDVGDTIRVQEVASNAGGAGQPAQSAPTAVVAPSSPGSD
jgi:CHAP domain